MIENLTNMYSLSKTLQFSLLPVASTEKFFNERIMEADACRDKAYPKMKEFMDRYHKDFIERCLSKLKPGEIDIKEYVNLYSKTNRSENENNKMIAIENEFRKVISNAFIKTDEYKKLMKPGEFLSKLLPAYLGKEGEEILAHFKSFGTYFSGYVLNRENMYVSDEKSTAIAYRCINDNLPKFIDNMNVFNKYVLPNLSEEDLYALNDDMLSFGPFSVNDHFTEDYFVYVLSQSGIEDYNRVIGGYSTDNGTKVKGLNEYINLYNQQLSKLSREEQRKRRIPILKPLYKQILSDREGISFIPETFQSDQEVLDAIKEFCANKEFQDTIDGIKVLFSDIDSYDLNGILFLNGVALTKLSQKVFGNWNHINQAWEIEYDNKNKNAKKNDAYFDKRKSELKKINKFTILELATLTNDESITKYIKEEVLNIKKNYDNAYSEALDLISKPYTNKKSLRNNDNAIILIKGLLESIKEIEMFAKPFVASGADGSIDETFYGKFSTLYEGICLVDRLYDKVRNYVTSKPYSKDKMKVTFNSSSFLTGWGQNFESKTAHIIQKSDKEYYLMIVDSTLKFEDKERIFINSDNIADLILYRKQKPDNKNVPRLFIRSKGDSFAPAVEKYNLPVETIIDLYDKGMFKTEYAKKDRKLQKESLTKLIDYFKEGFKKHEDYKEFEYRWKDSLEYNNISEFYEDTIKSCYKIERKKVDFNGVKALADEGKIYLFRIYSKDFSEYSKGTPNLHTLYFKVLFSEENMLNPTYQLLGDGEIFFRKASITKENRIIHEANVPIDNKNPLNPKKQSEFKYELIKDKRYTYNQFSIHFPIMLNFNAANILKVNDSVKKGMREGRIPYVIGIDRGERNLIFITVINEKGEIIEQKSLNEIISRYNSSNKEIEHKVNYQSLLTEKEKKRDHQRKEWGTIENIKELKEGYISQVVNEICKLVVKYDAIVALEDLSSGFKNSRKKVEKQVYDKFETMLRTKLEYLVDKKIDIKANGGLLKAYQLTTKDHKSKIQDGIMFFVPAWLTSKIDPTTGFVNLLYPNYTSVASAKEFIEKFDDIRYDEEEKMFVFEFDYKNFERTDSDYKKQWVAYSNGDRIYNYRNPEKNNEWNTEQINLTDALIELFKQQEIDYTRNLKEQILNQGEQDKAFYSSLLFYVKLVFQMRNSIPNSAKPEDDYIISPVKNNKGEFYDSRTADKSLPQDADSNGAYNIARKGLWAINKIINASDEELATVKTTISKAEWLRYCQTIND